MLMNGGTERQIITEEEIAEVLGQIIEYTSDISQTISAGLSHFKKSLSVVIKEES